MERIAEGAAPPVVVKTDNAFELSKEESQSLTDVLSDLSAKQFKAVRLDSAGVDTATIATSVKVNPATINSWRKNSSYVKARNVFVSIINRQGLRFRLDCQRMIMAPAYAELIRKTNDPRILKKLEINELLNIIKIIGKETRLDMMTSGAGEEDDDLKELMERRKNFSYAKQAEHVNDLITEGKIISFPTGTNGNQ